ncbi:YwpF-like family protein [Halalkalibacter urbisdiaboli]|uniref:YwpF-like family protein n=1 Tax=Halalkalibacter urbisdiaboli TaxID=1960589 RepID=UPI000B4405E1|nr:YwpF-like family protein [Halalkalibacter urbisdiaboli]
MKTFRLYSLSLLEKEEGEVVHKPIPVKDGLIINLENKEQTWYIDAVVSKEHKMYFENVREHNQNILVDVVITSKENHPAAMITSVSAITELSENFSILLEAKLVLRKDDIIEDVVETLVKEGFSGDAFFDEFKHRKEDLAVYSQRTLVEVYTLLKESGKYQLV